MDELIKKRSELIEKYNIVELCMTGEDALKLGIDLFYLVSQELQSREVICLTLGVTDKAFKSAGFRNARIKKIYALIELKAVNFRRLDQEFDIEDFQEKLVEFNQDLDKMK